MNHYAFTGPSRLTPGDYPEIDRALEALPPPDAVTTGGAHGLDVYAAGRALELWPQAEHHCIVVPRAAYDRKAVAALRGRGCVVVLAPDGPPEDAYRTRNRAMLNPAEWTTLIAFLRSAAFYRSGEWMTVNIARKLQIPVVSVVLDRQAAASALYEELRLLDKAQLGARLGDPGLLPRQQMIAEIIAREVGR